MELNYVAILIATILQFIVGIIWYMPIFGKLWGKMHGFEKFSKEDQQKMAKSMGPWYLLQLAFTFVMTFVFALLLNGFPPEWNVFGLAFFFWLGFIFPTQVSGVIFGGTESKWIWKKIGVLAGGSLVSIEAVALVFSLV